MIDLSSLKFSVDTSELDAAAKKIEALGTAVSVLSGDLSKLNKASNEVSKTQREAAKATSDAAKAEQELSNAKSTTTDVTNTTTAVMDAATRAVEKHKLAMKIFRGEAIELNSEIITLGSSFTTGQAGQLANIKLLGATNDQMKELSSSFANFNKITSANTFDNSSAGISRLTKDIFELTKVNELMQRGIALTRDEIVNLARDSERLTQQFQSEGLSSQQLLQALGGLEAQTIKLAKEKNELIAKTKASELAAKAEANVMEKAAQDAAKASNFLEREMSRVDNVLDGFNSNLNITSSNRLLKFREQLKASGTDAVTAEKMLKTYEERLKTINQVSQTKAKNSREEELKYLARATSVQLGDIGISLAGGQNPLLVLIQQGDQLRGVLNQVGASGGEMEKALSMAFSQIVVGTKDVVVALGSFVVGAFVDAGKSITEFGAEIFGVKTALEEFKNKKFAEWASEGQAGFDKISKAMAAMQFATSALGIGIGVLIALVASMGVALYQVTNANDTLTRSLIATGAQLGFTTEYAHSLAGALTGMGSTRVDVLNAFTEITNSGKITSESFLQVAEAALAIERVGGPAVKETVKLMGDLKEKTVETLSNYAEQTGLVTLAQVEYVAELVKAGKESTATTEATNILTQAIKDQATITYASLSPMSQLWITVKDGINNAWGALQNFAGSDTILDPLKMVLQTVSVLAVEVWYAVRGLGESLGGLGAVAAAVLKGDLAGAKNILAQIDATDAARDKEYTNTVARIMQTGKYTKEALNAEAEGLAKLRKENADKVESATKYAKVQKDIDEETLKNSTKILSRDEFINQKLIEKNKLLGEGRALREKEYEAVVKNAGIEWDKAQKKPSKPKVTDAEKGLEIYIDTLNKAEGVTAKFNNELELLQASRNSVDPKFAITEEQYVHAVTELVKQQPFYIKGQKEIADQKEYEIKLIKDQLKYQEELSKIESDNSKFILKSEEDTRKMTSSYALRLELLGKTEEQQSKLKEQAELENKLAESTKNFEAQRLKIKQDFDKLANNPKNNLVEIPWVEAEAEAYRKLDEQRRKELIAIHGEVAVKAAEKFDAEFKKIADSLSDAITTALFEGGQAGTKKLKDYITSVFRNAINVQINASVSGFMGGLTGGASGVGGAGNMLSGAGGLSTLFGEGSKLSGIGSMFTGVSAAMTSFGNAALATTQSLVGLSGTSAQMATSLAQAGYAGTSSIGATIGTVAPYVLAAVVVAQLLKEKEWETKMGGVFAYDPSKGTTAASVDKRYGNATGGEVPKQFMQQLLVDTTGYINGMFKALGSKAQVSYLTGGAESSQEGEAYSFAGGKFSAGGTFGNLNQTGNNLGNASPEQIVKAFALDLQKATLSALQAAADLPKSVQEAFKDVDIQGLSEEALTKLSTSISTMITETNSLRAALEVLPFKSIDNLSFDAAQNLIKFSGGIQNLTNNLSGYYDNFYTAEEKRKQTIQNITKTLNDARAMVGPVIPWTEQDIGSKTREQFRELFDSITATEPAGSALVAAMLSVQESFASVTLSTDELIAKEKE